MKPGIDFQPDSTLIDWPDSCAPEGAAEPVDYTTGRRQCSDTLFNRVLIVVAVIAMSVLAYVVPMGPAS